MLKAMDVFLSKVSISRIKQTKLATQTATSICAELGDKDLVVMSTSSTQPKPYNIWPCTSAGILGFETGIRLLTSDVWCCVSEVVSSLSCFAGGEFWDSSPSSEEVSSKDGYCLFRFFGDGEECGWDWIDKVNERIDECQHKVG